MACAHINFCLVERVRNSIQDLLYDATGRVTHPGFAPGRIHIEARDSMSSKRDDFSTWVIIAASALSRC
jgi:hypothetical protein